MIEADLVKQSLGLSSYNHKSKVQPTRLLKSDLEWQSSNFLGVFLFFENDLVEVVG